MMFCGSLEYLDKQTKGHSRTNQDTTHTFGTTQGVSGPTVRRWDIPGHPRAPRDAPRSPRDVVGRPGTPRAPLKQAK